MVCQEELVKYAGVLLI